MPVAAGVPRGLRSRVLDSTCLLGDAEATQAGGQHGLLHRFQDSTCCVGDEEDTKALCWACGVV